MLEEAEADAGGHGRRLWRGLVEGECGLRRRKFDDEEVVEEGKDVYRL